MMRPDKLGRGLVDQNLPAAAPTPAPKKQKPALVPIVAKPQPIRLPETPLPAIPDAEAEKRKKDAHREAWFRNGGGGSVGG